MFNWLRDWRLVLNTGASLVGWWTYGSLCYYFAAPTGSPTLLSREVLGVGFLTSVVPVLRERFFVVPPQEEYTTKQVQVGLHPDRRRRARGRQVTGRVLLLGALLLGAAAPAVAEGPWTAFEATVSRVLDGDTLSFSGHREACRLTGVDAPETAKKGRHTGQPLGEDARAFAEKIIGTRPVTVLVYGADRYGRMLCWLLTPGAMSLNVELVRFGLAEVYVYDAAVPPPFLPALHQAEVEAQTARLGVWGLPNRESPAAFRRRIKGSGAAPGGGS